MDPFNGGPASHAGRVCGCIKERHQSILLGTQTPDILEIFLTLFSVLSLIAVKTICKWQPRDDCQNLVAWFKSRNGQLNAPLEKSIETLRWNPFHVGCALVHRGFEILLKILFRFPFQPETVNEWFTVTVPREDVDVGEEEGRDLNVMNVNKTGRKSKIYSIQNNAAFPESLSEGNHKVFFHGTSHEGALDIIKDGINLKLGRKRLDFSNGDGFYLSDNLDEALDWAQGKHRPAVLIYRFSKATLDTLEKRDYTALTGQPQKKREWQNVVKDFRSGKPDRSLLRNIDCIEGPMAGWPPRNRYETEHPRTIPDSYQLCVRSDEMAEAFDRCLHSVLFVSK